MTNDLKVVHRRLVCNTSPFFEELKKLRFIEQDSKGHGIDQVRIFKRASKYVHSHHKYMKLFTMENGKELISHSGMTIHDEMLKFFATRTPQNIET